MSSDNSDGAHIHIHIHTCPDVPITLNSTDNTPKAEPIDRSYSPQSSKNTAKAKTGSPANDGDIPMSQDNIHPAGSQAKPPPPQDNMDKHKNKAI